MDGLVLGVLESVLGEVLLGEVSEGAVWVFGRVMVFPGFVALVVLFADDAFELVLAWVGWGIHWIWEARLSRRRELAMELCCSLGSMDKLY